MNMSKSESIFAEIMKNKERKVIASSSGKEKKCNIMLIK